MKSRFAKRALLICVLVILTTFVVAGIVDYNRTKNILNSIISILAPFIFGAAIAYVLNPFVKKVYSLERKIFKKCKRETVLRYIAITIVEVIALGIVAVMIVVVMPSLAESITNILEQLPKSFNKTKDFIDDSIDKYPLLQNVLGNSADELIGNIQSGITEFVQTNIDKLSQQVINFATNAVSIIINIGIGLVVNVMLLANKSALKEQCKRLLQAMFKTKHYNAVIEELILADTKFIGFFKGKILDSLIITAITFVVTLIMGIEYPFLVTMIVGVLNIIPFFGPFAGGILASLVVFSQTPDMLIWFILYDIIIQQIDGNIIGPKCIGNSTDLNAFWTLFAIIVFGKLFGVIGMIIGVPLFAVIYDIAGKFIQFRINKHNDKVKDETENTENSHSEQ